MHSPSLFFLERCQKLGCTLCCVANLAVTDLEGLVDHLVLPLLGFLDAFLDGPAGLALRHKLVDALAGFLDTLVQALGKLRSTLADIGHGFAKMFANAALLLGFLASFNQVIEGLAHALRRCLGFLGLACGKSVVR